MAVNSEILKQYKNLVTNIKSFSDNQASIVPTEGEDEDSLMKLTIAIAPNGGLYKGGTFKFKIELTDDYPHLDPPIINCLTKVYHPNIDVLDEYSDGSICLNLLDELWSPDLTLEDYVQGLLFMFYNPNVDDPLSPVFGNGDDDEESYAENVRRSMRGEDIDGYEFDRVLSDDENEDYKEPSKDDGVSKDDTKITKEDTLSETTPTTSTDVPRSDKDSAPAVSDTRDETTGQEIAEMSTIAEVTKATTPAIPQLALPWQPLKLLTVRAVQYAAIYVAVRAGVSILAPAVSVLFRTKYMPVR